EFQPRSVAPDIHESIGIRIRQRFQQDAVDDAEDRGDGSNAQRQGQCRDEGEPWLFPQPAQRQPDVIEQGAHHGVFSANTWTRCTSVSVVFSRCRRELNSSLLWKFW